MSSITSTRLPAALLPAALLIVPLLLAAPLASAAQPDTPPATTSSERASVTQQAGEQMQQWQHKIDDFAVRAKAEGRHVGKDTQAAFDDAWAKSKDATARLQHAGKSGWADAKKYYDVQTDNLTAAWKRLTGEDK